MDRVCPRQLGGQVQLGPRTVPTASVVLSGASTASVSLGVSPSSNEEEVQEGEGKATETLEKPKEHCCPSPEGKLMESSS